MATQIWMVDNRREEGGEERERRRGRAIQREGRRGGIFTGYA